MVSFKKRFCFLMAFLRSLREASFIKPRKGVPHGFRFSSAIIWINRTSESALICSIIYFSSSLQTLKLSFEMLFGLFFFSERSETTCTRDSQPVSFAIIRFIAPGIYKSHHLLVVLTTQNNRRLPFSS